MGPSPESSPFDLLDDAGTAFVARVMASARDYLDASVSFLAEATGSQKVIRATHGPATASGIGVGTRFPLEDTYCQRVLSGTIPQVIYDARNNPLTRDLRLTGVLGIDSYMGVPVVLPSGRAVGTLCCINFSPEPERHQRDLGTMRFLADLLGRQLEDSVNGHELRRERHAAVRGVLTSGGPTMLYQPIVELESRRIVGVEALSRFDTATVQAGPQVWFREAWAIGLGPELELCAIAAAMRALTTLPPSLYLAVNASPATIATPGFAALMQGLPRGRVVVEITEHVAVDDYRAFMRDIAALRDGGLRVAIDDVGAGYSSLRHVLEIAPDIAKLDMSLTRMIDIDVGRQAMAQGVVAFAERMGLDVVAEGVETPAEAAALTAVGVRHAQGFHFARPGLLSSVLSPD